MTEGPVQRWRKLQKEKEMEFLFYEKFHLPFKGHLFMVANKYNLMDAPWSLSNLLLKRFDRKKGIDGPIPSIGVDWRAHCVPYDEYIMATGKIVAKNLKSGKVVIHAIEFVTSKGIGYLPRVCVRGPLIKRGKEVILATDK